MKRLNGSILAMGLALVGAALAKATQKDMANRIDRHGDRYHNAGNSQGEKAAREAAKEAREASSAERAREIERDFNSGRR